MLRIQITKRRDGSGVLRCLRADGSLTWQKQDRQIFGKALRTDRGRVGYHRGLGYRGYNRFGNSRAVARRSAGGGIFRRVIRRRAS